VPDGVLVIDGNRSPLPWTHLSGEVTIPADTDELRDFAQRWRRFKSCRARSGKPCYREVLE
jgi:hypothetical protein